MNFLIDYNLTGSAVLFRGTLADERCVTRLIEIVLDIENYMGQEDFLFPKRRSSVKATERRVTP